MKKSLIGLFALAFLSALNSCNPGVRYTETDYGQFRVISQKGGRTLGYSPASGISILNSDGYGFKDLDRDGELDPYEDWRLSSRKRAEDLASKLSIEEIAGLMLYSSHQAIPTDDYGFWSSTYNGTILRLSGLPKSALSDKQKAFLAEDNLRAVLIVRSETPRMFAQWNNNAQEFCEGRGHGIPVNISSDPRHEVGTVAEFNAGSSGTISKWPAPLGLAATFDPDLVRGFGRIAAVEYRALGIATALSPQADLATDPRWARDYGTFGEDPYLAADLTKAYIDGFQESEGCEQIEDGWGFGSVNTMVKHWPGGGSGEGGRDAHYSFGKYSVYPNDNVGQQIIPFVEGAFKLDGKTGSASAVMPYYTVSYGLDPSGNNVGNSFSEYIINEKLRDQYGFDGVVCTDWGITHDYYKVEEAYGKPWGVETLSQDERHYRVIKAGVDQFGGNNDKGPVLAAYRKWCDEFGEKSARERFERSAVRLLMNMFRTGLFDNPYIDPDYTERTVGKAEFMEKGFEAQLKSVVMVKNRSNVLPVAAGKKVWFPRRFDSEKQTFLNGSTGSESWVYPIDTAIVGRYFTLAQTPEEADFALVMVQSPQSGYGYDLADRMKGGNGYLPISLQYNDYTADSAREKSIAGGDPFEKFDNRSYKGKTVRTSNRTDLDLVKATRKAMGDKPVVLAVAAGNPFVPTEIEPYADAILIGFGIQYQAMLDIASGKAEPQGLLPVQMPADMNTVELQAEDTPGDMRCYTDSEGNTYDFAFGLDWKGVIRDARVKKYGRPAPCVQAPYSAFYDGGIGHIKTDGWLLEFLKRQLSGMTGHPEALSYPYDSCLWDGENITRNTESYGSDWWRYEQTAYYTDGMLRLAYILGEQDLIRKGEGGIHYTVDHADSTGRFAHTTFGFAEMWPMAVFFRAMKAYYDYNRDEALPSKLEKHYLTLNTERMKLWRNVVSIEGMLWTYSHTHNPALLNLSEEVWNAGLFTDLTPEACAMDHVPFMHGVTFCEELKLPMLLYAYTGKERYKELALNAHKNLLREHMLPDGVPVSAEALYGRGEIRNSHETCDIADYTWTLGYFLQITGDPVYADMIERAALNACPGAVTKDFKSLQYFSSVNQVRVTGDSNHNGFFHGSTWMAYRPTHQTECCAGNVHRIMPNYVDRMWMRGPRGEVVSTLFGPSEYCFEAGGKTATVKETTEYPFDETITYTFRNPGRAKIALKLRIPQWCENATLRIGLRKYRGELKPGSFVTVEKKFSRWTKVRLTLPMKVSVKEIDGKGYYVERGPLLYALDVAGNKVEDTTVYENMNGKVPENPDFKCWSITPASEWNYALSGSADGIAREAKVSVSKRRKGYPFDLGNSPVTITVPARKIDWPLEEDRFTPEVPTPDQVKPLSDEIQNITLVPYGATELRVSVFPFIR